MLLEKSFKTIKKLYKLKLILNDFLIKIILTINVDFCYK